MRSLIVAAAALALFLSACVVGPRPQFERLDGPFNQFYSHTTVPLDVNAAGTDTLGPLNSRGDIKRITYYGVSASWGDNSVGELGRRGGFEEVLYADIEVLSVFFGFWTQTWVHVYGR